METQIEDATQKFADMLNGIATRPAMYVGSTSLRAISHLLDGYCFALYDMGCQESPFGGWMSWIESRFLIASPAWHWTRILLHVYGSEKAVIAELPLLYAEFLAERNAHGIAGIEAQHDQRLMEAYGETWHVPKVTKTKSLFQ